ncbi:hypothetical protein QBC38DRAFT_464461 [Podospora fimiseda]|uniref:Uncharacterized protein n=1 Tax=Podospora fimiseda TaxID=252190 RepID=A0AAN7H8J1_9PEZI|nr:hypothetical protein QBC38DRAFT_464461 [Podospora fimiseda]
MAEAQYQSVPLTPMVEKLPWSPELYSVDEEDRRPTPRFPTKRLFESPWIWLVHAVLISVSLTLLVISLCLNTGMNVVEGFQPISADSPISSAIKYHLTKPSSGSTLPETHYVGHGPDVDDTWESITSIGNVMITDKEREKLGLPSNSQRALNLKTGESGYRAAVEVFDQLRCLNLLRQSAHRADGEQKEDRDDIDACVEMLRETLMCHSDVGITTFKPSVGGADGSSSVERQSSLEDRRICRNFEEIRKWGSERTVV